MVIFSVLAFSVLFHSVLPFLILNNVLEFALISHSYFLPANFSAPPTQPGTLRGPMGGRRFPLGTAAPDDNDSRNPVTAFSCYRLYRTVALVGFKLAYTSITWRAVACCLWHASIDCHRDSCNEFQPLLHTRSSMSGKPFLSSI